MRFGKRARTLLISAAALVFMATSGCAHFEAARFYRSGTQALDRGDTDTAIFELEQAAVRAPRASEIQNHLGLAYAAAGRNGAALAAFERAVELDCENAAAQENLAAALAQAR